MEMRDKLNQPLKSWNSNQIIPLDPLQNVQLIHLPSVVDMALY